MHADGATFEGIKIQLFAREHPPPHFHAVYAEHRAQIEIESLRVLRGSLPPAKMAAVVAWAAPRRITLLGAWEAVLANKRPEKIE